MGQHQASPFQEGKESISDYRVVRQDPEEMLTYLIHVRTSQEALLKEITFSELRQFSITTQKLKARKSLSNNHITLLKRFEERNQDSMCSNFYKIFTLWDYPHRSLAQQLSFRRLQGNRFTEQELWELASSVAHGMKSMQEKQIKHECLTLQTIRIDSNQHPKVADPLANGELPNFDVAFNNRDNQSVYLSPQQCWSIRNNKPIQNKNCYKNDVFTLGMILAECATFNNQSDCYENGFSQIRWEKVDYSLANVAETYGSQRLKNLIEKMLDHDIQARPDWLMLSKMLSGQKQLASRKSVAIDRNIPRSEASNHFPSLLPTIKSVESEGTYTNSSTHSYPLGNKISPQQGDLHSMPNEQLHTTTISYSSFRQQPNTPPLQMTAKPTLNRITFNSPSKAQVSFNIMSSPNRSTLPVVSGRLEPTRANTSTGNAHTYAASPLLQSHFKPTPILFESTFGTSPHPTSNHKYFFNGRQSKKIQLNRSNEPFRPSLVANQSKKQISLKEERISGGEGVSVQGETQYVQQFFKLGSRYEGYKLNGMRHGRGKFFYQDGGCYDGEWRENKMNGIGSLYYQSNTKAYEGQWLNDQFHGRGVLYNQNPRPLEDTFDYTNFDEIGDCWVFYEGQFVKDAKEGQGLLKFSNGEQFRGTFRDDMVQGQGWFTTKNNVTIHGIWHDNQLVKLLD